MLKRTSSQRPALTGPDDDPGGEVTRFGRYRIARGRDLTEAMPERVHPRVDAVFKVKYATVDELVVAYSGDLSQGGLFLCTERFLPINAVVRVHLELPGDPGALSVICRVAYVRDVVLAAEMGKPSGMGVEFLDLTDEQWAQIEDLVVGLPERVSERATLPRLPIHVLIVDDDETIRRTTALAFEKRGDHASTAVNGVDALGACLREPPDAILSDIHMPSMDGWQLLRVVRTRPTLSSIPFLFFTTLGGEQERLRGYQLGVDDYIAKPTEPDLVVARVERTMSRLLRARRTPVQQKALRGDLEHVSLPAILKHLQAEEKTGDLLLVGIETVRVYVRKGQPVRAEREVETDAKSPEVPLKELLDWTWGQFEFANQLDGDEGDSAGSLAELLLSYTRGSD